MSETAWLIELRGNTQPFWWKGGTGPAPWTTDSLEAVRFCREQDAEATRLTLHDAELAFVSEHLWVDALASQPAPCPCHSGSVCTPGCEVGCHHDGCPHDRPGQPAQEGIVSRVLNIHTVPLCAECAPKVARAIDAATAILLHKGGMR